MIQSNINFVTFCTKEYLIQALTLISSLRKNFQNSQVFFWGLDNTSSQVVSDSFKNDGFVYTNWPSEIQNELELIQRNGRSKRETIFALKPILIEKSITLSSNIKYMFYCDADLYFFESVAFEDLDRAIILSEHLFSYGLKGHSKFGIFNAGLVGVGKSKEGLRILRWWKDQCLQSTSLVAGNDVFGDQKYLEKIPYFTDSYYIYRDKGINQSMWTFDNRSEVKEGPVIDNQKLSIFHFHGLKICRNYLQLGLYRYGKDMPLGYIYKYIYKPYIKELAIWKPKAREYLPRFLPKSFHHLLRKDLRIF